MAPPELPTAVLRPGDSSRVIAGHPWIYAGSIARIHGTVADGDLIEIQDPKRRMLGIGFFNSRSKIRIRVLSSERAEVNSAFFESRIREADQVRKVHLPRARSYRVVNAESDFLSGLIVDRYEDVLVVQISSFGMERRKIEILDALQRIFAPRAMIERSDIAARRFEGMEESSGVLHGAWTPPQLITLNGLQFEVDLLRGHKTGAYLDQTVNYLRLAELVRGGHVLDCFTFQGGFALHAARAGAETVHAIDQSEEAVAVAQRHAEANGLSERCTFETANVFDWLKRQTASVSGQKPAPRYDLVILDPPSFTRNRAAIPDALRGYKEIHLRALKLLKRGGTLATFCCSHHISATLFLEVILEAALDARRVLRRVAVFEQSPDHPVLPAVPETEYLKGFAFELAR